MSDVISGTIIKQAIDRVEQRLFAQDWQHTKDTYGEDATPALMARTAAQRRHDALVLLIERGSAADPDARVPQPLVNVVIDWETFTKALRELAGGPEPQHDTDSTCELLSGTP